MKNEQIKQSALFPEIENTTVSIHIGLNEEGARIGCWVRVDRKPSTHPINESISWHNYTENGLKAAFERVWEIIGECEEHHGLRLEPLTYDRASAPF